MTNLVGTTDQFTSRAVGTKGPYFDRSVNPISIRLCPQHLWADIPNTSLWLWRGCSAWWMWSQTIQWTRASLVPWGRELCKHGFYSWGKGVILPLNKQTCPQHYCTPLDFQTFLMSCQVLIRSDGPVVSVILHNTLAWYFGKYIRRKFLCNRK